MPHDQHQLTGKLANITIRGLAHDDLATAFYIQAASYPAFLLEDPAAFASRLGVPATYCLAAVRDGALVAYLLAHGWAKAAPPPVGAILNEDVASEILFIHDLAVSPAARGLGLGRNLIDHALGLARHDGLGSAELIAVEGAASYWEAQGFAETAHSPSLVAKVAAYGRDARWMTRNIW